MKHLLLTLFLLGATTAGAHAEALKMDVKTSAGCGCCVAWINQLRDKGFAIRSENLSAQQFHAYKRSVGIRSGTASCHTARIAGYTIEGHVPLREIRRLLKEKPDAIGLSVPGMPVGSPGMEDGTRREAFTVLLIRKDGSTEVYARYPAVK